MNAKWIDPIDFSLGPFRGGTSTSTSQRKLLGMEGRGGPWPSGYVIGRQAVGVDSSISSGQSHFEYQFGSVPSGQR